MGCLVSPLAAGAADGASGNSDDSVTIALPRVVPGELVGDLSVAFRGSVTTTGPREKRYRPQLLSGVPPKTPELAAVPPNKSLALGIGLKAAVPSPIRNFEGLARLDTCAGGQCGTGSPPDPNGDVGPNHYVQAVNTAYAIYDKTGTLLASFTEDRLWSGSPTPCSTDSQGDPIVLYDALADRWILTHFAFTSPATGRVPPFYQCIAVSKSGDPVAGGWWLYPVRMDNAAHPWLNDYAKFGVWHDCLYMSANGFNGADVFQSTIFASFSRADMYAGASLTASIGYNPDTSAFTMIPANLSGQAGALVPPGTPAYFVAESQSFFGFEVRKFVPGPNCGAGGTLAAPVVVSQLSYSVPAGAIVPQPGTTTKLDTVGDQLMQKAQYRKIGAVESLWVAHTFRSSNIGPTGVQWAQINVTGGTVSTTALQQQNYDPGDSLYRWLPSLGVDGQGNMAVGYSRSGSGGKNYPGIYYSGRLASDAPGTLPQTETTLIAGGSSQTGMCGGFACTRWGDYAAMSVDPADDCTFWLTNQYYPGPPDVNTVAWHTRIGSFKFPGCAATSRSASLAISNSDGVASVTPGAAVTYTIVVTNAGPFAVSGATVTDFPPPALTGVTWTCSASAGSGCPASGSVSINTSAVNLQNGGSATFILRGTVSMSPPTSLSNTATVTVPAGYVVLTGGNSSATDTDTVVLSPPNATMAFNPATIVLGQTSVLTVGIVNPNAGAALTGIGFSDPLPAGISTTDRSLAACGGTLTVVSNVVSLAGGSIVAGGSCTMPITVSGVQTQPAPWINTIASVTSNEGRTNDVPVSATIAVGKAGTTIGNIVDNGNPSTVGQAYAPAFSVAAAPPGTGTPTGAVMISDGAGATCTAALPTSSCALSSATAGTKTLTFAYGGDARFNASAATVSHVVNAAATSTAISNGAALNGSATSVNMPYPVTWTVSVLPPGALGAAMTGSVSVRDGTDICVAPVGAGTCSLISTTAGTKAISALYSGDANYAASAATGIAHSVSKLYTTTSIIADRPDPSVVGAAVAVQVAVAVVAPGTGSPSGQVVVTDGVDSCTVMLPAAGCNWMPSRAGALGLTATYAGDANFFGSTSSTAGHTVVSVENQSQLVVTRSGSGSGTVTSDDALIECGATCVHLYPNGTVLTLSATPAAGSIFTGWLGACIGAGPCSITISSATAASATFAPATIGTGSLDIDADGNIDALTDGLTVLRYLFGLRGSSMTSGTIASGAARSDPAAIGAYLDNIQPRLDVDGNGRADALTDGLLIIRYMFGLRGGSLISNAVGAGAARATAAQIEAYIDTLMR